MDPLRPSRSSTGTANGVPTTFHYDSLSSSLSWHPSPDETVTIPSRTVIAVVRNDANNNSSSLDTIRDCGNREEYKILHIETSSFCSTTLTNPPPEFLLVNPPLQQVPPHLSLLPTPEANIHIIISTLSGTGLASSFHTTTLLPTLLALRIPQTAIAIHTTTSPQTITSLARTTFLPLALAGQKQTIILLSGDGGILDLINVLHPEACENSGSSTTAPPTISLLPLGSGNALANSLLPPTDGTLGLSTLIYGHARALPTFKARFSPGSRLLVDEAQRSEALPNSNNNGEGTIYGAVVFSWGLHATLVADSDTVAYRKFGAERFLMAGKEALFPADGGGPHEYRAKITLFKRPPDSLDINDGENITASPLPTFSHSYILATLVPQLEKGFTISPSSRPLDGQLRLVRFGPLGGEESMRLIDLAYAGGKHVNEEVVGYEEVEGLRIEFMESDERWRRVCVDGKIIMVEESGWAEVWRDRGSIIDVLVGAKHISLEHCDKR